MNPESPFSPKGMAASQNAAKPAVRRASFGSMPATGSWHRRAVSRGAWAHDASDAAVPRPRKHRRTAGQDGRAIGIVPPSIRELKAAMSHRRTLLALAATGLAALPAAGRAQTGPRWMPDRPLRVVVPFAPGGTTDVVARVYAEQAAIVLGQPLVVENRPGGAAGLVGMDVVAKAAPDGQTLLIHSNAHVLAPALVARLPFDPIDDFSGIAHLGRIPQVLVVHPRSGLTSLQALVTRLRAEPGRHHFATGGLGSAIHVGGEVFRAVTGAEIQPVHYRGGGPAMQAVITGEAIFTVDPVPSALGQIRGGSVRALAVAGPQRVASLPDVPTAAEAGLPEFRAEAWLVALAPARTPSAALEALQAGFAAAQRRAASRLTELGVQPVPEVGTQAQLMAWLREEMGRGVALLRAAGVQPE